MEPGNMTFVAESLTFARQRRGWNRTNLAKGVGISLQLVSQIERGHLDPSEELVESLANTLGVPNQFLYVEPPEMVAVESASFRSLSKMRASQRDVTLRAADQAALFAEWSAAEFNLPGCAIPDLNGVPMDPSDAATFTRSRWGLGNAPITRILDLVESNGVRVFALPRLGREVDGVSMWHGETPIILVATDRTAERIAFDIAHELGHLVLHRDHHIPRGRDKEREANEFASALLMPSDDVIANAPRLATLEDVSEAKHRWGVSAAALNYRMKQLDLISEWHNRQLCIELAKYDRTTEPNPAQHQHSQLLTKLLGAARAMGLRRGDIARELLMSTAHLNELLNGLVLGIASVDAS